MRALDDAVTAVREQVVDTRRIAEATRDEPDEFWFIEPDRPDGGDLHVVRGPGPIGHNPATGQLTYYSPVVSFDEWTVTWGTAPEKPDDWDPEMDGFPEAPWQCPVAEHIARHDPQAVLSQCDAVERLLTTALAVMVSAPRFVLIAADLTGTTGPAIDALRAEVAR